MSTPIQVTQVVGLSTDNEYNIQVTQVVGLSTDNEYNIQVTQVVGLSTDNEYTNTGNTGGGPEHSTRRCARAPATSSVQIRNQRNNTIVTNVT